MSDNETTDAVASEVDQLRADLAQIAAERDAAKAALDTANEELRAASQDKAAIEARITELESEVDKAVAAASVAEAAQGLKARKFKIDDGDQLAGNDLQAAIAVAERVELVFCQDGKEVIGLLPVVVSGDAWSPRDRAGVLHLMLHVPIDLAGPPAGQAPFVVDGFGLVLDGKPVAHALRINGPIAVSAGQRLRIADDVIF